MCEALPPQDIPKQPENDLLPWNTSAKSDVEAQPNDQPISKSIGRLAIDKVLGHKTVDKLSSFYGEFRKAIQPKKRVVSAYSVFVDPTVPSPGCIYPPSGNNLRQIDTTHQKN